MSKVIVYGTANCKYCTMAKDFFKEKNVEFEEINISENPDKKKEMIEMSGQMGVPVILVDSEVVLGFQKNKLVELLNLE